MSLRGKLYALGMKKAGKNFQVSSSTIIKGLENLTVGNNVYLAPNIVVNVIDEIIIDDEVMIGFNSVVVSGNHTMINGSFRFGKSEKKPIIVNKGTWIGANCTILAGANIPKSSIIAANSSVGKCFYRSGIYGGSPAKFIKELVNE
jgi:maltose O-acetyltransferase